MDAAQYFSYQKLPTSVSGESLKELEEVLIKSPWFADAQILYAVNLFKENHPHYSAQLKKAAVYAPDRRILKGLMDLIRQAEVVEKEPLTNIGNLQAGIEIGLVPEKGKPVPPFSEESQISEPAEPKEPAAPETALREQLLTIVHRRLEEITASKQDRQVIPGPAPAAGPMPKRLLSKEELVEKFIREEPRISTPKATFFNPTQSAVRSNVDEEEIVTETLARLYAEQGNQAKAIKIYEKLSLLFPEKSRYFAAQIEKITLNKQ